MDNGHLEIARSLMKEILYENGYVDRWHSEESQMSKKWEVKIAPIAGVFFDNHPELLTDEHIEQIASGGIQGDLYDDLDVIYINYPDIKDLRAILDDYLNDGCGVYVKKTYHKCIKCHKEDITFCRYMQLRPTKRLTVNL
jgi:hypothetical protein